MNAIPFGDLFTFIRNGMNVKQDKSGEGLPITRIETISVGTVDGSRVGYAGLQIEDCKNWLLKPGDILFSHINSVEHIGKCAVYKGTPAPLVHGMNLLCLRPEPNVLDSNYAQWLIRSSGFRSRLSNFINKAVNQASVSIGNLRSILVDVPVVKEQRRIAAILDQAEALRAKRRQALTKLDTLTQSLFLEMFGDPATNPYHWPAKHLSEACTKITDGTHHSPEPQESGVPYITAKHVDVDKLDFYSDPTYIAQKDHEEIFRRCDPRYGDVLYIKDGATTGRAAINRYDFEFSMLSSLALLRPNTELCSSEYLCAWLNQPRVKEKLLGSMAGAAIRRLTLTKINAAKILLPPIEKQRTFDEVMTRLRLSKHNLHRCLDSIEQLNQSLQNSAFRGEL